MTDAVLTLEQLAQQGQVDVGFVLDLVRLGILSESSSGFEPGDVLIVRVVRAAQRSGTPLGSIADGLRSGRMDVRFLGAVLPELAPMSGRTFGEFVVSLGEMRALVGPVAEMLGVTVPPLDIPMRADDEVMLQQFMDQWAGDGEIAMRAARLMGQTIQRLVEGWTGMHYELYRTLGGPDRRAWSPDLTARERDAARSAVMLAMGMTPWLMVQYVERVLVADIVDHLETEVDPFAERPDETLPPGARVPAIAFVDISGFTALTEASGDDAAGRLTARFEEAVARSVARHGGRVVKWLGDGAVLQFLEPRAALEAVRAVREDLGLAGLVLHAGIDCGSIVERDGDVFGRTVNLASRLASLAGPGQVVVSEAVAAASRELGVALEPMGPVEMKGISRTVVAYRLS